MHDALQTPFECQWCFTSLVSKVVRASAEDGFLVQATHADLNIRLTAMNPLDGTDFKRLMAHVSAA